MRWLKIIYGLATKAMCLFFMLLFFVPQYTFNALFFFFDRRYQDADDLLKGVGL